MTTLEKIKRAEELYMEAHDLMAEVLESFTATAESCECPKEPPKGETVKQFDRLDTL